MADPRTRATAFYVPEHFVDALSMMRALAPLDPRWREAGTRWAFRGQANSAWDLLPSAYRADSRLDGWRTKGLGVRETDKEQMAAEWRALRAFAERADATGLPFPDDHHLILLAPPVGANSDIMDALFDQAVWPMPRYHGVAALAQHHGVPTSLLDWSSHAEVGAYFAGRTAADWALRSAAAPQGAERLSITAVDLAFLGRLPGFSVIPAARSSNANLHAQHGLFTLDRSSGWTHPKEVGSGVRSFSEPTDFALFEAARKASESRPVVRELTLPISEAPELLRILRGLGVSAATIFPGFDGVARDIVELGLFADPESDC